MTHAPEIVAEKHEPLCLRRDRQHDVRGRQPDAAEHAQSITLPTPMKNMARKMR